MTPLGARTLAESYLSHGKIACERGCGAMYILIHDGSPEAQEAHLGIAFCALEEAMKYLKLAAGAMPALTPHWAESDEPKWADESAGLELRVCQTCGKEHVVCRCNADYAREQAEYGNIDTGGK